MSDLCTVLLTVSFLFISYAMQIVANKDDIYIVSNSYIACIIKQFHKTLDSVHQKANWIKHLIISKKYIGFPLIFDMSNISLQCPVTVIGEFSISNNLKDSSST